MTDSPDTFQPSPLGDPSTKPDWAKPFNPDYISGYNACLKATRAATLLKALQAAFPACIGYDGPGHIKAHNTAHLALLELGAVPDGIESTDALHPEAAAYRDERHALQRERDGFREALTRIAQGACATFPYAPCPGCFVCIAREALQGSEST